jgi:hypothetical protein
MNIYYDIDKNGKVVATGLYPDEAKEKAHRQGIPRPVVVHEDKVVVDKDGFVIYI